MSRAGSGGAAVCDFDDDICDHEYEDYDVIEGTATCYKCWHRRHVTSEEWRRLEKAQAEYDLMCEDWDKEQPVASDEPVGDGIPF
jgi:hypothetical protein